MTDSQLYEYRLRCFASLDRVDHSKAEFDFRYDERVALGVNDKQRVGKLLKGATGKRLPYR
jgi:hypothetical protein